MGIINNLYIILNGYKYKEDFIKLVTKIHLFHIIIIDYDTLIDSIEELSNNDLVLFFIENEEQLEEFIDFLDISLTFPSIFLYAPSFNLYTSKEKHIHHLPECSSPVEILHHMEPSIRQFKKPLRLKITVDQYMEEVLEHIGAARHLSGYKYLKFILNYALKHFYLEKDLFQAACNACVGHFEVSESSLEKALRDLIDYAYTNNYYSSYLFLLHYNMLYHKSTNTKYIEAAMDYTINHFKDAVTE